MFVCYVCRLFNNIELGLISLFRYIIAQYIKISVSTMIKIRKEKNIYIYKMYDKKKTKNFFKSLEYSVFCRSTTGEVNHS
jgi:hypothetical protein